MAIHRIQIANNKKSTSVKHQKKDIAKILGDGKEEKARIKVEHIIRDDFMIEAYEILELLCELVHERIRQLSANKECPVDLQEAVSSLIWATANVDIDELKEVKKHLQWKFGFEFTKRATDNVNNVVNLRLYQKLTYQPPSRLLVDRYLEEIAKAYNVEWSVPDYGKFFPQKPFYNLLFNFNFVELEEASVLPLDAPYPTPSGYSIPMAPGSGLADAYTSSSPSSSCSTTVAAAVVNNNAVTTQVKVVLISLLIYYIIIYFWGFIAA